jgi:hypothetical protein
MNLLSPSNQYLLLVKFLYLMNLHSSIVTSICYLNPNILIHDIVKKAAYCGVFRQCGTDDIQKP